MANQTIIVVGGGLAGLMTTIKIAEAWVKLFSLVPVKRSHSVCAQGGINGAVNTKGEGDSPWEHFDDTIYGGDFLANQQQVLGMCEAAPAIIHLMDRMGVMFNRTPEGLLDFRRFGGTKHHRTAFAAPRQVNSCCTRWTSRFVVTKWLAWSKNTRDGISSGPYWMTNKFAAAYVPKICVPWKFIISKPMQLSCAPVVMGSSLARARIL
ncbi:hypothetical protein GCM10025858_04520 [Alicyclobacillus sacchari]|nr:hypothetical protein GCM10025858_04520 [Alicyclobacillus sacchari]